jgi:hypothetical protein
MLKLSLAPLSLCLAVSAAAQVRVSPSVSAWAGPVSRVLAAAGSDSLERAGSLSLTRLGAAGAQGTPLVLEKPELLEPLVQTLEWFEMTPSLLERQAPAARLEMLLTAAVTTEDRLVRAVNDLHAATGRQIGRSQRAEMGRLLSGADKTRLYLGPEAAARLTALAERAAAYDRARREAFESFMKDLPGKLAAGAFDSAPYFIAEPEDGGYEWRLADADPDKLHPSVEAALDEAITAADAMPAGPWLAADAAHYKNALRRAERLVSPEWRARAEQRVARLEARSRDPLLPRLTEALENASAGRASIEDLDWVSRFYAHAVQFASGWRGRARVIATVRDAAPGRPAWRDLRPAADKLVGRANALFAGWTAAATAEWSGNVLPPTINPYGSPLGLLAVLFSLIAFARWTLATEAERIRDGVRDNYLDGR